MAGFFDDPMMSMYGTTGQPGFMSNPGIGPFATNLGLALIAAGSGGGAPRSRFGEAAPFLSQAINAPMQMRQQEMMQKLYAAQLKQADLANAKAAVINPIEIRAAQQGAQRTSLINDMLGVPNAAPASPSMMDGPTVENAARLEQPGLMAPGGVPQPPAGSPFANLTPLQRLAIASDPKGATEKLMALGQWEDQARGGIPGQVNKITNEWKPLDPTLSKVTVNPSMNLPPAETEFEKKYGNELGGQAAEIHSAAEKSRARLSKLSTLEGLLSNLETGKLTPATSNAAAWGKALGVNDDTLRSFGLDPNSPMNAQAASGLMNGLTMEMIGPGGMPANNFSEADRQFVQQTMPQLTNTPEGNRITTQALRQASERQIVKEKMWLEARKGGANYADFLEKWNDYVEKTPLFPKFTSADQMRAAKKGTVFTAPDGSIRVVQ